MLRDKRPANWGYNFGPRRHITLL